MVAFDVFNDNEIVAMTNLSLSINHITRYAPFTQTLPSCPTPSAFYIMTIGHHIDSETLSAVPETGIRFFGISVISCMLSRDLGDNPKPQLIDLYFIEIARYAFDEHVK